MDNNERTKRLRAWIADGLRQGFCTPPGCYWHDGVPLTADDELVLNGDDEICVYVMRVCFRENEQTEVEANDTGSRERKKEYL